MEELTIGGKGTYSHFGFVLEKPDMARPVPKYYRTDIPGGNGTIDQTEFGGDTVYANREDSFKLAYVDSTGRLEFLQAVDLLTNYLHGRSMDYTLTWDPGYTYQGRFEVGNPDAITKSAGRVTLNVSANPYKSKGVLTWLINAAGGVKINLPCGRKRQSPLMEVQRRALVNQGERSWTLEPGTYLIRSLWITQGDNELIINTYPEYGNAQWTLYADQRWNEFVGMRFFKLAAADAPINVPNAWIAYTGKRWSELLDMRCFELAHPAEHGDDYSAYIQYEWKDL